MGYLYSPSTKGFYINDFHEVIPDDALQISDNDYETLMEGQSKGGVIQADDTGYPIVADQPDPNEEILKQIEINRLERLLKETDYQALPDYQATKTPEDIAAKLAQRQAWREKLAVLASAKTSEESE